MSKTSTDLTRHALSGPTMGARWSALFFADGLDPTPVQQALQAAAEEVDAQMSTWRPDSDLMRLNAAPVGEWVSVPAPLMTVLRLGLEIGRASTAPVTLDLNGIAKGYGVDRLAETLRRFGIGAALVGIDGEMRAFGLRPDGAPWAVAVEAPPAAEVVEFTG